MTLALLSLALLACACGDGDYAGPRADGHQL